MHDKMMKMLMSKKKQGKTLSDSEKKSKLEALGGMRDMASQMMGDKLKNLKKVVVAADSTQGFSKGPAKKKPLLKSSSPHDEIDSNDDQGDSMYSDGGRVEELPDHENPPKDPGPKGRKIGQLPEEFDRDEDHVKSEHSYDRQSREFNEGGDVEESAEHEASESPEFEAGEHEESLEQMVDQCNDPEQIDELIKKLEEKKQQLSQ